MKKSELKAMVDQGITLDLEIKEKEKILDQIKNELKAYAKASGQSVLAGTNGVAVIDGNQKTLIETKKVYDYLMKQGKSTEFFKVSSILIGELKKIVNDNELNSLCEFIAQPFSKISFKKSK